MIVTIQFIVTNAGAFSYAQWQLAKPRIKEIGI